MTPHVLLSVPFIGSLCSQYLLPGSGGWGGGGVVHGVATFPFTNFLCSFIYYFTESLYAS